MVQSSSSEENSRRKDGRSKAKVSLFDFNKPEQRAKLFLWSWCFWCPPGESAVGFGICAKEVAGNCRRDIVQNRGQKPETYSQVQSVSKELWETATLCSGSFFAWTELRETATLCSWSCYHHCCVEFQAIASNLRRPLAQWIWKNYLIRVSEQGHLCCGCLVEVTQILGSRSLIILIWVLPFLDRQGLVVAAPVDLRTQNSESFSPQLLLGFWAKLKENNLQIVVMSPTITSRNSIQKKQYGNNIICSWL